MSASNPLAGIADESFSTDPVAVTVTVPPGVVQESVTESSVAVVTPVVDEEVAVGAEVEVEIEVEVGVEVAVDVDVDVDPMLVVLVAALVAVESVVDVDDADAET